MASKRQATPVAVTTSPRRVRITTVALGLLLLGAAVLRALLAHRSEFPSVDGVFYIDQARWVLSHGELPLRGFPPGWPLVIALPLALLGLGDPAAPLHAAQIANVFLGTALGWLTWRAFRDTEARSVALIAAAIVLFLPKMIQSSAGDMSEMTYACAVMGGCLLLHRERPFAAGLAYGYAYLVRPEGLLIAAGLVLVHLFERRRAPWRLLAGVVCVAAPYMLFLTVQKGALTFTSKGGSLLEAAGNHPDTTFLRLFLTRAAAYLPHTVGLLGWPVILAAVLGAVVRPGRWLVFVLPGFAPLFFDVPTMPRFWLPTVPFLLFGAVRGGEWIVGRWFPTGLRRGTRLIAAVLLIGLVIPNARGFAELDVVSEIYAGQKEAGLWLRERVEPDTIVASYKPYPSFWAGCRFEKVPAASATETIAWCRNNGVEYLVVDVFTTLNLRPELKVLLQRTLPPDLADDLTLLELFGYPDDYRQNTAVYRIEPRTGSADR